MTNQAELVLRALQVASDPRSKDYCNTVSFSVSSLLEPEVLAELTQAGFINDKGAIAPRGIMHINKENNILSDIRRLVNTEAVNFFKLVEKSSNSSLIFLTHLAIGQMGQRALKNDESLQFWEEKLAVIFNLLDGSSVEDLAKKYDEAVEKNKNR